MPRRWSVLEREVREARGPLLAGVDEVGRGPLAGPVVACAVVFPPDAPAIRGVDDSKELSGPDRERLATRIRERALNVAVGAASVREIDRINIYHASVLAIRRAIRRLPVAPHHVLIDGNPIRTLGIEHTGVVGGDACCHSIACASIIAKVTRDRLMRALARRHPHYHWETNVGYGTPDHHSGLASHGITPHHRRSFSPVQLALALGVAPPAEATEIAIVLHDITVSPMELRVVTQQSVFRDGLFSGQVALVTGGGSGIGRGIADLLASLGAHVVLASRKLERVETAAAEIRAAGGKASAVTVDVREPERVQAMVAEVHGAHGRIDLLVNNAAGNFYAPSESLSPNAWKSVIEIDLYGTFFCSQAVLPVMRAQGGGSIVNISMTLHYRGWPLMAHATAAKAGIDALTKTLALEWARDGVRMNSVAPGPIPTEGVKKAFTPPPSADGVVDLFAQEKAMEAYAKKMIPLQRFGSPADIANMVAFLASPAASWITGAIMVVDGGEWLAKPPAPSPR